MNKTSKISGVIILLLSNTICFTSCRKETAAPAPPVVTTTTVSDITQTSASTGGTVIDDGGTEIIDLGVCWGTTPNPTISSNKTSYGKVSGSFTSNLTGLAIGTTYHVRAYAENSAGTAYGDDIAFATTITGMTLTVSDRDGNVYHSIGIGYQMWMVENLKTTKYNDGTAIPNVSDNAGWPGEPTADAYCWYNNDVANKTPYGALYNVVAVNNDKICPLGWHVATNDDWHKMILFLDPKASQGSDESYIAGGMVKESGTVHWDASNIATNESGLTALPGGIRYSNPYGFAQLGYNANFWSAGSDYQVRLLISGNQSIIKKSDPFLNRGNGNSVRCVKD
jgi:uncharacterized protein (TIGR02145 family)